MKDCEFSILGIYCAIVGAMDWVANVIASIILWPTSWLGQPCDDQ